MNPRQPNEFFPWLAGFVDGAGPFVCERAHGRADGRLCLTVRPPSAAARLIVSFSPAAQGEWTDHVGALRRGIKVHGARNPRDARIARAQAYKALCAIFRSRVPPLMESRNREVTEISLNPGLLRLTRGALRPGVTRVGDYLFVGATEHNQGLRLGFRSPAEDLTFSVLPAASSGKASVITKAGPLVLRGEISDSPAERAVADHVGYVLSISFGDWMKIVGPDPMGPTCDASSSFVDERCKDAQALWDALFASCECLPASSMERECIRCLPVLGRTLEAFHRPAWTIAASEPFCRTGCLVTRDDSDAVLADGEELFEDHLLAILEERRPRLGIAVTACLPKMLGDSVESVVDRVEEATGVPFVVVECNVSMLESYSMFWDRLLKKFPHVAERSPEPSVNLLGFGHEGARDLEEIGSLLARTGMGVNQKVMPAFDPLTLPDLGRGWLNVMRPSLQAHEGFKSASAHLRAPLIAPPAPCGVEGTFRWLNAVRSACGMSALGSAECARLLDDLGPWWESLREQASGHRLGVILGLDELQSRLGKINRGIAWLEVLHEMGFGVDLLVLSHGQASPAADRLLAPACLTGPRHRVTVLSTEDELRAAMTSSDCALVYSDRFRDWRASASGKGVFSTSDLELGLAGACRSAARLLERCNSPFHRRYRAYARSPDRGPP